MAYDFDYFVIGAGSGGVRSARIAATLGAKVGIAEATHFGGTCVNIGCIPKKIFSYAADYGTGFDEAENYGWTSTSSFNWAILKSFKDKEISRLNNIYREILNINKVDVFEGYASFIDAHTIQIGDQTVAADKILIATGGKPQKPDIKGSEFALVSDDIFALETLPEKIVILGAGYIALEFAHILHGLGRDVTIIHRGDYLLKGFDIDIQDHLLAQMQELGIAFKLNQKIEEITKNSVILADGEIIKADLVLTATGRVPNTEKLCLNHAGVKKDNKGFIEVDAQGMTSASNIFAVGDVTDTWKLTPVAIAQGHALADRLFGAKIRHTNFDLVPTAVFSKPEIGTVGLTEQQAAKEGLDYEIFKTSFRPLRHTITGKQSKILMKMIVEKTSRKVLGLHIGGPDAAEMIQIAAIAMNAGATKEHFSSTLPVHPTSAEELVFLSSVAPPYSREILAQRA